MKRLIKNYTTDIPVERTVAEIQKILSENGASAIAIEYHDGAITDIFFKVKRNGQELPFRLPAKVDGVYQHSGAAKKSGNTPATEQDGDNRPSGLPGASAKPGLRRRSPSSISNRRSLRRCFCPTSSWQGTRPSLRPWSRTGSSCPESVRRTEIYACWLRPRLND